VVSLITSRALARIGKTSGPFISTLVARLTRNPILKVFSSIRAHKVCALLMGGQACVF